MMKGENMIGAIIGDIAGSRFERMNFKGKNFTFFYPPDRVTDDSIMTLAVAQALLKAAPDYGSLAEQTTEELQHFGRAYPRAGYGGAFKRWLKADHPEPYNSYGNGSAMRVSACGWAAKSLEEALELAETVTAVTHNHPEGIHGAQAVAAAVYLARTGKSKEEIRRYICENFYPLDFTLDEIRNHYKFDVTCRGSVPQALEAFFEAEDFEDAVRNAVSIGGDSDTIAAIAGSVAEAYYGVPDTLRHEATEYLKPDLLAVLEAFEEKYPPKTVRQDPPAESEKQHAPSSADPPVPNQEDMTAQRSTQMDFAELTENLNMELLDELEEVINLKDTYERHIRDGIHEAVSYRLDRAVDEVFSKYLKELTATFYHLMCEDPNADDEALALYGMMLAEENVTAGRGMTYFIKASEEDFKNIIEQTVLETIEKYKEADFEEFDDDDPDFDDDDLLLDDEEEEEEEEKDE